jgi:hypothetical protein
MGAVLAIIQCVIGDVKYWFLGHTLATAYGSLPFPVLGSPDVTAAPSNAQKNVLIVYAHPDAEKSLNALV